MSVSAKNRRPIVIAYHLIWTNYGNWLPNDPRGSGSHCVESHALAELGELHFGRRRIQPAPVAVRAFYQQAEPRLKHSVIRFDDKQINLIAIGVANAIAKHRYTCYACAIMPDHMHVLIRKHRDNSETMIENLQAASRKHLVESDSVDHDHPIWTDGGYKRFLSTPDDVRRVIRYVDANPSKSGLNPQSWPFVKTYDGWPLQKRAI